MVLATVEGLQRSSAARSKGSSPLVGVVAGASKQREGREAGEMVEGSSTLPPHFLGRVNPWNARSLNKRHTVTRARDCWSVRTLA